MKNKISAKSQGNLKSRLSTLTIELLEGLFAAMDEVAMHNINRYRAYESFKKVAPHYSNTEASRILHSLTSRGYLKAGPTKDGQISVELTSKAEMKIVDKIVAKMELSSCYYFMSFDIPEQFRSNRNKFRKLIKRMGFVQIQQSLWAINKNVGELVQKAATECQVEKYVAYIVSAQSDIDIFIGNKLKIKSK